MQEYFVRRADITTLEQLTAFLGENEFAQNDQPPNFRKEGGCGFTSIKMQRGGEDGSLIAVLKTPVAAEAKDELSVLLARDFPADLKQLLEVSLQLEAAPVGIFVINTFEIVCREEAANKLLEIIESEEAAEELSFRKELEHLLNRHSKENGSDTPDFILAEYLANCLENFDLILQTRERWYGREVGGGAAIVGGTNLES